MVFLAIAGMRLITSDLFINKVNAWNMPTQYEPGLLPEKFSVTETLAEKEAFRDQNEITYITYRDLYEIGQRLKTNKYVFKNTGRVHTYTYMSGQEAAADSQMNEVKDTVCRRCELDAGEIDLADFDEVLLIEKTYESREESADDLYLPSSEPLPDYELILNDKSDKHLLILDEKN